jgi:uncharacterized RDD family membrane protein YckC
MNPPEAQSDSESTKRYFDPEAMDSSEQFFSASLESAAAKSDFAPDSEEGSPPGRDREPSPGAGSRASYPSRSSDFDRDHGHTRPPDANQEKTPPGPAKPCPDSDWRNIVSAKVKRYKRLRPRKEHYPSLAFEFDAASSANPSSRVPAGGKAPFLVEPEPDPPQRLRESRPPVRVESAREATGRVLEFPRPGMLPFNPDELAEPVVDRPRIMEAPELVPPPPALGGILIEPARESVPERSPGVDMPVRPAPVSQRAFASVLDGVLIALGLASFPCLFLRFNPALPDWRTSTGLLALFGGILWFAYQAAFIIFCGTTPGLRAAGLKLACFDGNPVPRNSRRWRVVASILSGVSLGLGYAWCFFDEDRLSWHDRITKTHLSPDD